MLYASIAELNLNRSYRRRLNHWTKCNNIAAGSTNTLLVHTTHSFKLSDAMAHLSNGNPKSHTDTTHLESQCILAPEKNAVWCDDNGVKLLQYYHRGVKPDTSLYQNVLDAIEHLLRQHGPSTPGVGEARHCGFEEWKATLPLGTPCGTYRFTVHHTPGHPPPHVPFISSDLLANSCGGSNAGVTFRASDAMKDLSERISLMFASIDPDTWDRYRRAYIETANRFDSLKVFDK